MKKLLWVLILVFFASIGGNVRGQSSPAFDPDVYLPKFGDGIDTIQGHDTSGFFGSGIINLGPGPDEPYGRIAMQGMPGNAASLTTVHTGHDFDLHKLKAIKQLNLTFNGFPYLHWGHLHSTRLLDLVVSNTDHQPSIYWGDSLGNFDSNRVTRFERPASLGSKQGFGSECLPYVTYLSSDTLEDLVWMVEQDDGIKADSFFVYLYQGGESLFTRRSRPNPDSSYYLGPVQYGDVHQIRNFSQGDWRGVGREDLIAIERYPVKPAPTTWFYYRNESPFSMANLARAISSDTLFLARENPHYSGSGFFGEGIFSMAALPKSHGDKSVDFMPAMPGIYIFRGGPDFGSKHLFMDSAEAVIKNPADIDIAMHGLDGFGRNLLNCGDMTGSGYPVLLAGGNILSDDLYCFYVLGKAVDDKIDIYYYDRNGLYYDTLIGDVDNRPDMLFGSSVYSRLMLLHGSNKIPVKLNPKYSVGEQAKLAESPLYIFPNPATSRTTLLLETKRPDDVAIIVRDILGREVFREERKLSVGILQIPLTVKSLMNGTYIVQVKGKTISLNARLEIVR
jgi:hypothetical protein